MKDEIAAAVLFITRLIKMNDLLSQEQVNQFMERLSAILSERFQDHWYHDKPYKGQGYRCIRINEFEHTDPILQQAAEDCGMSYEDLMMPLELTLWVDPSEVSCRFGECSPSTTIIACLKDGKVHNNAENINIQQLLEQLIEIRDKEMKIRKIGQRINGSNSKSRSYSPVSNMVPKISRAGNMYHNNYVNQYTTSNKSCTFQSPKHSLNGATFQKNDRFHWVRESEAMKA